MKSETAFDCPWFVFPDGVSHHCSTGHPLCGVPDSQAKKKLAYVGVGSFVTEADEWVDKKKFCAICMDVNVARWAPNWRPNGVQG